MRLCIKLNFYIYATGVIKFSTESIEPCFEKLVHLPPIDPVSPHWCFPDLRDLLTLRKISVCLF